MLSFQLRISVITQTIGDIITSNKHRRCLPKHGGKIVDVSPRYMRDSLLSIHALNFSSMSRCLGEAWRLVAYGELLAHRGDAKASIGLKAL